MIYTMSASCTYFSAKSCNKKYCKVVVILWKSNLHHVKEIFQMSPCQPLQGREASTFFPPWRKLYRSQAKNLKVELYKKTPTYLILVIITSFVDIFFILLDSVSFNSLYILRINMLFSCHMSQLTHNDKRYSTFTRSSRASDGYHQ